MRTLTATILMLALACGNSAVGADAPKEAKEPVNPIGNLKGLDFDKAKAQTEAWLKEVKADADATKRVEALWDRKLELTVLERVAESLMVVDPEARDLIESVRSATNFVAPTEVPELVKDPQRSEFYRNNLGLYFAKQLAMRRVHEQVIQTLTAIRPEKTVDPASYYFFKAVAHHKLQQKVGLQDVDRLLKSVVDAPERYIQVAELMRAEMSKWKDNDMGFIARSMEDLARRFDLARAGKENQVKQEEVIALLDKMIKEMEKQGQGDGPPGPSGNGPNNTKQPKQNAADSYVGGVSGNGDTDKKKIQKLAEMWGKLPDKERVKAMENARREYPALYREASEEFTRLISKKQPQP